MFDCEIPTVAKNCLSPGRAISWSVAVSATLDLAATTYMQQHASMACMHVQILMIILDGEPFVENELA